MQRKVFSNIEVSYNPEAVSGQWDKKSEEYGILMKAFDLAERCIRPRAVLRRCSVAVSREAVYLEGRPLTGGLAEVLTSLRGCSEIALGVMTAGDEIDYMGEIKSEKIFTALKLATLSGTQNYIFHFLREEWGFQDPRWMNPGILDEMPIGENRILFRIIGNVFDDIGVEVSDDGFMNPEFTISVIYYDGAALCRQQ